MNIQIVTAIPEDVFGIRNVQKITWLHTYPNSQLGITLRDVESKFAQDDTEAGRRLMEERKKRLNGTYAHTWVAKDGDEIIGFCGATNKKKNKRIGAMYVLPKYQGKGIGKQLIRTALDWLGDEGSIYVNAASYNQKAILFYEKFGFEKSGRKVQDDAATLPSGTIIPELEMVKTVHPHLV